ncbi:hypothetical protein AB5J62_15095 [Amycolatopsis sp. cg5]|uniref:hypothetical protein n=1 Tax=Amycolatopsis sp. cg5 TaxID=3238802 RepID=UPI00352425EE
MVRVPLPRPVVGERVRLALEAARPGALKTAALVEVTELSLYQVRNGLRWIRETAAVEHLTPLTWTFRSGYAFSDEPEDWVDYEQRQVIAALTKLELTITGVFAPHQGRSADPYVTMAVQQINGVISALKFVRDQAPRSSRENHQSIKA